MDADSIKIVCVIFYLTFLVVIACIWFRVSHAPNGDIYRQARRQGGYGYRPYDVEEPAPED